MVFPKKLAARLSPPVPPRKTPVWKGPEEDGITFSLLSRFLVCRERFRLLVVEGLRPVDSFNTKMEYGNMWHACEEAFAAGESWELALKEYAQACGKRYPAQPQQVSLWYNLCKIQFPLYVDYWAKHPDIKNRTPLLSEHVFNVPYRLPSGRTVRLRGKYDSVDLVRQKGKAGVWLMENKTKSAIDVSRLTRQLGGDLQVMIYLTSLQEAQRDLGDNTIKARLSYSQGHHRHFYPIVGIRYNVVRRPLSGGKGTIKQLQPSKKNPRGESKEEYYARLAGILAECQDEYFARWNVAVTPGDIEKFRRRTLDPILEQLCNWWEWVTEGDPWRTSPSGKGIHWQHPFGVWNPLDDGGSTDLDEYLATGSEAGLRRIDQLFTELV